MNIHTMKRALGASAVVLALAAPGIGWAGEHYLGLTNVANLSATNANPATSCTSQIPSPTALADKAIVTGSTGALTRQLTLRGLCAGSGSARQAVTFTGTLTPVTRAVKMCKSWTAKKGNTIVYGWLDQGVSNIGVTGTLTNGQFRVVLTMDPPVSVSTTCDANHQGEYDYTVNRNARVFRDDPATGNIPAAEKLLATANFTFGNVAGSAPEPGTLSLLGLGLAGLGWMGARRARKARVSTV